VRRTILTATAVVAAVVGLPGIASAADPAYVTPTDLTAADLTGKCPPVPRGDFCTWERDSGNIEIGLGAADLGLGGTDHLLISTPLGNDKANAFTFDFAGQPLSAITGLGYRSFVEATNAETPFQAPALNITIDSNGPATVGGFATLVWEPVYTSESKAHDEWISRSPLTSTGGWWSPANATTTGEAGALGFTNERASWANVLLALPNATVGGIGINQGGGNPGLVGQVDLLTVNTTVYDFESTVPVVPVKELTPTAKQDCKGNNWTTFNAPTFRNQGECVSSLMSARSGR
jgi:hypothetical protein